MQWSGTQVLMTGGAGHIGSALVARLVEEGARVRVVDSLWRGSVEYLYDHKGKPVIDLKKDFVDSDLREFENANRLMKNIEFVFQWQIDCIGMNLKIAPTGVYHQQTN